MYRQADGWMDYVEKKKKIGKKKKIRHNIRRDRYII